MESKKTNKKAQMREYLIPAIVVIISAAIIIFFIAKFQFQSLSEKEACKQSVIFRSANIKNIVEGKMFFPLQCKTQEIQIKDSDEEKIKETIANAMYDCWDMLGEGKLDFLGSFLREAPTKRCLICSRIIFKENIKDKVGEIPNFYQYLATTIIPGKNITYASYFFGGNPVYEDKKFSIYTSQDYAVIYQEISGVEKGEVIRQTMSDILVGGGAGFLFGGPLGAVGGIAIGIVVSSVATAVDFIDSAVKGCKEQRCVGVFLIPYNAEVIGKTCQTIESIP